MINLCTLALLISSLLHSDAATISMTVGDVSLTSSVVGSELLILLTKETFTCGAGVEFNGTTTLADTILHYNIIINDAEVDTGSLLMRDMNVSFIESNEISIEETGNIEISMNVWFDDIDYSTGNSTEISAAGSGEIYSITGFTTMVPLIFVVLFAVVLQNVYVSLYLGIWIGSFIISGVSFRYAFEMSLGTYILGSAASEDHQFVILFTVFLSGLVYLIQRSGGTKGFSSLVSSFAKNAKYTQFACFVAGLAIFFDDYANALVVGATFQPLTDMFHVSREKLAFLVDATSAPDASLWPLSSWIGFELQQIQQQLDIIKNQNDGVMPDGLTDNAFVFFVITIPTRFYPIYMLVFQVILMSLSIEFGPMLIAERLTRVNKSTDGGKAALVTNDELDSGAQPAEDTPGRWWNMLIPILTLIILILAVIINSGAEGVDADPDTEMNARNIFANSDPWGSLLYGTFGASVFTVALFMFQFKYKGSIVPPSIAACKNCFFNKKKSKDDEAEEDIAVPLVRFPEAIETWIQGIAFMTPAVCILILVWAIGAIMVDIGADRYFTRIISEDVSASSLPTLVFILSALLSAATGTSWGTMTILFPLVSPATWAICEPLDNGVFLYTVTLSQILSGSIFGDHSSPLSDTTLISSVATGCDLFRHVYTQMPYAIWVAFFSVICGTLMIGQGINAGVCIFVGILVQTICTWFVAAPVLAKSGRYDVFTELYLICLNKCKCKIFKNKEQEAEQERDERELVLLKRQTREFVRREGKQDADFLLKLLTLTKLNMLCEKCGIDINDDGKEVEQTYSHVEVHMTQTQAQTGANVVQEEDGSNDTQSGKEKQDKEEKKTDGDAGGDADGDGDEASDVGGGGNDDKSGVGDGKSDVGDGGGGAKDASGGDGGGAKDASGAGGGGDGYKD